MWMYYNRKRLLNHVKWILSFFVHQRIVSTKSTLHSAVLRCLNIDVEAQYTIADVEVDPFTHQLIKQSDHPACVYWHKSMLFVCLHKYVWILSRHAPVMDQFLRAAAKSVAPAQLTNNINM
jgi:hypothetical protein